MGGGKTVVRLLCLFVLLNLVSCADSMIGKQLPGGRYHEIDRSTHNYGSTEHVILDYDSSVDRQDNRLAIRGSVTIKKQMLPIGCMVSDFTFVFYFMDKDRTIVGASYVRLNPKSEVDQPIPFDLTADFSPDYKYVTYKYEILCRD